ncbi:3-hydroxyacyl-ACP dehydratase [Desulfallas sp. Bu1-1]|uniref:acyl-CoA dehydratase activase n=1 Tax=Desulfallas sp. Bu1-1 TaxID=2787620 RepID=UPI00189E3C1F|nr:acyl-CoA dehydratase activase [Desulfallas sp. Bu1-1]MBF7081796.1 3-hydroxyacyl-ACP dehydratase [Desulfallas sp. Bu1-1]
MTLYAGIDIGSRTIGFVALAGDRVLLTALEDTGHEPLDTARKLLNQKYARVVATGYGRHSAKSDFAHDVITEIKAHALGAAYLYPGVRTVLDIGGQDTKVILLNDRGSVTDFQMNDRCSAGTGKFLEVMAGALGYTGVGEFGEEALKGKRGIKISNMCTVFAESEAVSLLHRGAGREDIALALHVSVVERTAGMLQRVGYKTPLVFTGGVANNRCIVTLLAEKLGVEVIVPPQPQLVGALGAALAAATTAAAQ